MPVPLLELPVAVDPELEESVLPPVLADPVGPPVVLEPLRFVLVLPVGPDRTIPPGVADDPVPELVLEPVPELVEPMDEPPVDPVVPVPDGFVEPALGPEVGVLLLGEPEAAPWPPPLVPEPVPDCARAKPPPQDKAAAAAMARILEVFLMRFSVASCDVAVMSIGRTPKEHRTWSAIAVPRPLAPVQRWLEQSLHSLVRARVTSRGRATEAASDRSSTT